MFNKKFISISFIYIFICVIYCSLSFSSSSLTFPIKTKYILTSPYGFRTFDNSYHDGIDMSAAEGTPVYAMHNGIVTYSGFDISGGYMIIIQYDNGYKSMYCHLSEKLEFKSGESVKKDSVVGYVGPKYLKYGRLNGYTTGVHLHFGLYKNGKSIDPFSITYN